MSAAVRVKSNGREIYQAQPETMSGVSGAKKIRYFNIWLNLHNGSLGRGRLSIEFKIFGVYIPVASFNYILPDASNAEAYSDSDSFVDPCLLSNPSVQGSQLEEEINHLPAVIRETVAEKNVKEIRSILLARVDQLGDFILTLPAIHELKQLFPNAAITIMVSPSNEGMAKSVDLFDEVITIPFSFVTRTNYRSLSDEARGRVIDTVGGRSFDLAIDLSTMPESRELLGLVTAGKKFGIENTNSSMLDTGLLIHAKDPLNCLSNLTHAAYPLLLVDLVKRAMTPCAFHLPNAQPGLPLLGKLNLASQDYIVIHSGARNILVKWDIEKFIALATRLSQKRHLVFFADDDAPSDFHARMRAMPNVSLLNTKLAFSEFDAIISNACLFVGNDSGPKHLAALRNVPVVSIHSPRTNWSEWGQIDSGCIVSRRAPCAGCGITSEDECGRGLQCLRHIEVDEVMSAVDRVLDL